MKFIEVHRGPEGFTISADAYVKQLDGLAGRLPAGAWAFASDPGHYDFYGTTCVKDLNLRAIDHFGEGSAKIIFGPNEFKHEKGLTIVYENISRGRYSSRGGRIFLSRIRLCDAGRDFACSIGMLARNRADRR